MDAAIPSRLTLTPDEKASPLWKRIEDHLTKRLHELRVLNDGMKPENERCQHIGRIAEVKAFLQIAEESRLNFGPVDMGRPGFSGTAR